MTRVVAYDCEIRKGIPGKNEPTHPDIEYASGWRDFENMGVSLITCYDFSWRMPRVFMDDNIIEFFKLIEPEHHNDEVIVAGFNNNNFDDNLLKHMGVKFRPFRKDERDSGEEALTPKSFDLLRAIWKAAGLDPTSYGYHHQGYGLDDCCKANIGQGKRGNGALAAILYQRKQFGSLIDYGLTDIMLTAYLLELCARQPIVNPKKPAERLFVEIPFDVPSISPAV
jgi:hypothetical protein